MPGHKEQALCWDCAKACGLCSWSNHWEHRPVPGWMAEKSMLKVNGGYEESYCVRECPEFEPDARRGKAWTGGSLQKSANGSKRTEEACGTISPPADVFRPGGPGTGCRKNSSDERNGRSQTAKEETMCGN